MAVTHYLYGNAIKNMLTNSITDLSSTTTAITLALMSSDHSFTQSHEQWGSVSANEISSTGDYARATMSGHTVGYNARVTNFDAVDVNFGSTVSIAAYAAVVLFGTGASTGDLLISSIDFDGKEESVDGTFEVQWNSTGLFTITVAATS